MVRSAGADPVVRSAGSDPVVRSAGADPVGGGGLPWGAGFDLVGSSGDAGRGWRPRVWEPPPRTRGSDPRGVGRALG